MPLNRIIGYDRQPVQGGDDIGLWTQGQRVRKDPELVKKHAEGAFRDARSKLVGVGSALGIINDPRGADFRGLMDSKEFERHMEDSEKAAFVQVQNITKQVLNTLENPVANRSHSSGPTGVLEDLRKAVTPLYDAVCPVRLPDEIALLVDVSHEAGQYRKKEKRLMSGKFTEFAKHEIASNTVTEQGVRALSPNTATEQILKLKAVAEKLKKEAIVGYLEKYNENAIVATMLLEARKKGTMDELREFLNSVSMQTIQSYSPYRNYQSGTGANTTSSGPGSGTGTSSSAAGGQQSAKKSDTIKHFESEKEALLKKLGSISKKDEKEKIASVNHDSITLIKSINSMLDVLTAEEKVDMDTLVEQIHAAFNNRAARLGLKVNYIDEIGRYDLSRQEAEDAFAELKEDVFGWIKKGYISPLHNEKFLEERKEEFINAFNSRKGLYTLRRGKGYEAGVINDAGSPPEDYSGPVVN